MSKVADSLKRKLGPLPVWAWAIIGGMALYWFRSRRGNPLASATGSTTSTATAPQPPVTLGPGESVYDPNTGGLFSSPSGSGSSGDSGGGSTSTDPGAAVADAASAIAAAIEADLANNGGSSGNKGNHKKVRLGSGGKRKPKTKLAHHPHNPAQHAHGHTPGVNPPKSKPRSRVSIRAITGGRTAPKKKPNNSSVFIAANGGTARRTVKPTSSAGTRARSRPTTNMIQRTSATQHPVATHPRASTRQIVQSPPRPSSPAPRTPRVPAPHRNAPTGRPR